jgi:hypothetical protein
MGWRGLGRLGFLACEDRNIGTLPDGSEGERLCKIHRNRISDLFHCVGFAPVELIIVRETFGPRQLANGEHAKIDFDFVAIRTDIQDGSTNP